MLNLPEENLAEAPSAFLELDGQRVEIPPMMLESEHPHAPAGAGDGRLHVAARDPHWLYVHWDVTRDQQAKLNAESDHGHLIVRVYAHSLTRPPVGENHVHSQSRHWFTHVETPGTTYYAELGFYAGKEWQRVAVAGPITTPPKRFAFDTSANYLTIHPERPLDAQLETRRAAAESSRMETFAAAESGELSADWSPGQYLAVLRALGVIRVATTVSGDSGAGESVGKFADIAESALETGAVSSTGVGFGETPAALDWTSEFSTSASSTDALLFSLEDFHNPSS